MAQAEDPLEATPGGSGQDAPSPALPPESPVPEREPVVTSTTPQAAPPTGLGGLVLTAVAVLASGLGIAFVIERYLASPRASHHEGVASTAGATDVSPRPLVDTGAARPSETRDGNLSDPIAGLSRQVQALQKQLDALSGGGPQPEVAALQVRVADLTEITNKLVPLLSKFDHLDNRLNELSSTVTALRSELTSLPSRTTPPSPFPTPGSPARDLRPGAAVPPSTTPTPLPDTARASPARPANVLSDTKSLATVSDLFRRARYKDARDASTALTARYPDDARVWYYAALSSGFTTRDWSAGAARLAEKGVAREEAGTPRTADIDAEFKDLTTTTGKNWLSFYRKRFLAKKPGT